jgi:hypothetical protein
MIIHDFHVPGVAIVPAKADSPLVVHANAVLAQPVVLERLKTISRRRPEFVQRPGGIEDEQLASCNPLDLS